MHKVHKRVHDPQLVKHLPGRNHKANMVDLEGCCREGCGVGSETLLFVKWNTLINFKIYLDKNISLTHLSSCGMFVGDFLPRCIYHQLLNGVDPQGTHMQAQGLC